MPKQSRPILAWSFQVKRSKRDDKLITSERIKAKGKLASEIAHELNTPIGAILMYSHLLLEDMPEGDPRRENIIKINKLANRCKMIVKGLLDFSSRGEPLSEKVQINQSIRNVVSFLEDHVLFKEVSIRMYLDPALPSIQGNENKLEQVFVNLIVNAAQSMEGKGTLTLSTEFLRDRNQVRITCADTGCGIDPNHMETIFEPFFTTKEDERGTGLGLSICHGIIEHHGGTIMVDSAKGEGSTFTILLPVVEEDRA